MVRTIRALRTYLQAKARTSIQVRAHKSIYELGRSKSQASTSLDSTSQSWRQNYVAFLRPSPEASRVLLFKTDSQNVSRRRQHWKSMATKQSQGDLVRSLLLKLDAKHRVVDIGINLADPSFDKDRNEVIERSKQAGVAAMVITGSDLKSSRAARGLAATSDMLYFTAGVHPHKAKSCDENTLPALRELAADPKCVAIGECGLDFNRDFSPRDVQEHWFNEQVKLAVELHKPLFLHCRDADSRFAAILRQHTLTAPAVAHCFTGTKKELQELLDLDLHIGITGWVCDDRPDRGGQELADCLESIPPGKLMIETDGPYLVPRTIKPNKVRPHRNEPALLPFVLEKVAQSLGQSQAEVAEATTATAQRFFGLKL